MMPLVFLGGVLTGAAGLLGAAIYDSHKTEAKYSPLLKTPEKLSAEDTGAQLHLYYLKAQEIYGKCNDVMLESIDLVSTPIDLPDDSFFTKSMNLIGAKANGFCRHVSVGQLQQLMEDAHELYGRYKGVFKRANTILRERGRTPVDLGGLVKSKQRFSVDNSPENENWDQDLQACADIVINFLELSCAKAEELIDILEQEKAVLALPHSERL